MAYARHAIIGFSQIKRLERNVGLASHTQDLIFLEPCMANHDAQDVLIVVRTEDGPVGVDM